MVVEDKRVNAGNERVRTSLLLGYLPATYVITNA